MKIELFLVPNDKEGILIKEFLTKNNIKFHEIIANNIVKSFIKITYNHSIHIYEGFNECLLNQQIIEHIKKYNAKCI